MTRGDNESITITVDGQELLEDDIAELTVRQTVRSEKVIHKTVHPNPDQKSFTIEDPIPWVYGMDCETNKYYSYNGHVYRAKMLMQPCVWAPDSPGTSAQWEQVS